MVSWLSEVVTNVEDYKEILKAIGKQKSVTFCLLQNSNYECFIWDT